LCLMPARGKKLLGTGVSSRSRSERYHSKGLWAIKAKNGGKWPAGKPKKVVAPKTTTVVKETKKGKRNVVRPRVARSFASEPDVKRRSPRLAKTPTLRASLVPGRVCIVLAGKYAGRRVIALKTLPSGLVVVTGPTSLNTVPLRRISPAYLIATSLKIDLTAATAIKILEDNKDNINDKLFEKEAGKRLVAARQQLSQEEKKKLLPKRKPPMEEPEKPKLY